MKDESRATKELSRPRKRAKKKRRSLPPPPSPVPRGSIEAPGSSSRVSNPRGLRQYAFIKANEGVNWKGLDPLLLQRLNTLGRKTGYIITLTSGFRTYADQRRLYYSLKAEDPNAVVAEPGSSRHEVGDAADGLINGQPIGEVIDEATINSVGLQSLSNIGDPVHVELSGGGGSGAAPSAPATQQPMAPTGGSTPVEGGQYTPAPYAAPDTAEVLPFETDEGMAPDLMSSQQRAETWQLIANQPGSSPEAQALARIARRTIGG